MSAAADLWMQSEGDEYHQRNADAPAYAAYDLESDYVYRHLVDAGVQSLAACTTIIDVGCSYGRRTETFHAVFAAQRSYGIDPSRQAVDQLAPPVTGVHALAHTFDVGEQADLLLCNFVMHWVDRAHLMATLANIDRHTKTGGVVVVSDFAPCHRHERVPYDHHTAIGTYKAWYEEMFMATGMYRRLASRVLTYPGLRKPRDDEPVGAYIAILQKGYTGRTA